MPDVKISALPSGTANASAVVPATNAAGTTTQKITLGAIAALGGGPPASHTHGNLTNAGAIGTTSGLPVKTGTSGVLEAGAFGTTSGTFCQGNDARLPVAAPTLSYTTTDQTVTTYTLTDATNMAFTAAANATYLVSLVIIANDDNEVGLDAKMVVPAGATVYGKWDKSVQTYAYAMLDDPLTDRAGILVASMGSPGVNITLRFDMVVVTSGTSGTVKLQFAQNNDDPGIAVTLKAGSWIFAQRIS